MSEQAIKARLQRRQSISTILALREKSKLETINNSNDKVSNIIESEKKNNDSISSSSSSIRDRAKSLPNLVSSPPSKPPRPTSLFNQINPFKSKVESDDYDDEINSDNSNNNDSDSDNVKSSDDDNSNKCSSDEEEDDDAINKAKELINALKKSTSLPAVEIKKIDDNEDVIINKLNDVNIKEKDNDIEPEPIYEMGKHGILYRENEYYSIDNSQVQFIPIYCMLSLNRLTYSDRVDLFTAPPSKSKTLLTKKDRYATGFIDLLSTSEVKMIFTIRNDSKIAINGVGKFCFQIKDTTTGTTIILSDVNEEGRNSWMELLKSSIKGVIHTPSISSNASIISTNNDKFQNKINSIVTTELPRKIGFLKKKVARIKSFKKLIGVVNSELRYFRLDGGELFYYADEDMSFSKLKRSFQLQGAKIIPNEQLNQDMPLYIIIKLAEGNILKLKASTIKIALEWKESFGETLFLLEKQRENSGKINNRRINITYSKENNEKINNFAQKKYNLVKSSLTDQIISSPSSKIKKKQTSKVYDMIKVCLQEHFLISKLNDINEIIDSLKLDIVLPGDIIINQGDDGDLFYILEKGCADVIKDNTKVGKIIAGNSFGDLALFNSVCRTATIKATSLCFIWTLHRNIFRKILTEQEVIITNEKLKFLKSIKFLEKLGESSLEKMANLVFLSTFIQGERIFKQGDVGDCFYLIISGSVSVSKSQSFITSSKELIRLSEGSYFGELALIDNSPRAATVTAIEKTKCWTLDKINFNLLLGSMQEAVGESEVLSILKNVKVLSSLTTKQLTTVARSVTKYEYEQNEIIIKQGDDGDTFYMISKGEVSVQINHVEVAILDPGQHFGEMSLLSNEKRSATIVANEDTTCYLLKRSDFVSLLGNLDSIIKSVEEAKKTTENASSSSSLFSFARNMTRRLSTNSSSNEKFSDSKYADAMFGLDNLHRVKQLGTGTFSSVFLTQHSSGKTYALKVMHKENVISQHQEVCVFREREIMHKLDHPFIAALYATIQDEDSLYLVQQYISGGDFWSFIYSSKYTPSKNGSLKVEHTVFYSSIIISILTYLHNNDIVYRDLKSENIMIESSGYLKLIDFGCAKKMKNLDQLTNTMCGSPEFIAPEVILSKGHNRAADYWSFGIILYEMLTRSTPFYHDNAAIVYQNIIESKEVLKKLFKNGFDEKSKDLILKLLVDNPNMRLGMLRNGIDDILRHPYFTDIDIDRINRRLIVPPYIPNSMDDKFSSLDSIEFDDDFDDSDTIPRYQGKFDFSSF